MCQVFFAKIFNLFCEGMSSYVLTMSIVTAFLRWLVEIDVKMQGGVLPAQKTV